MKFKRNSMQKIITICLCRGIVLEEVAVAVLAVECGPLLDVLHEPGDQSVHLHRLP